MATFYRRLVAKSLAVFTTLKRNLHKILSQFDRFAELAASLFDQRLDILIIAIIVN